MSKKLDGMSIGKQKLGTLKSMSGNRTKKKCQEDTKKGGIKSFESVYSCRMLYCFSNKKA
jgi:hypothetical protein